MWRGVEEAACGLVCGRRMMDGGWWRGRGGVCKCGLGGGEDMRDGPAGRVRQNSPGLSEAQRYRRSLTAVAAVAAAEDAADRREQGTGTGHRAATARGEQGGRVAVVRVRLRLRMCECESVKVWMSRCKQCGWSSVGPARGRMMQSPALSLPDLLALTRSVTRFCVDFQPPPVLDDESLGG